MNAFFISAIIFLAIFTQAVSGFGVSLVAMSLLVNIIGIREATPLVALVATTAELIILIYYRHAFNLRAVTRLSAAAIVGIPLGLIFLQQVAVEVVTAGLGILLLAYSLYALLGLALPQLNHPNWAYGFGFIGGVLGGAYNTSGPPVIIYGTCQGWPPAEFKSNLQGFFILISSLAAIGHALSGNLTSTVWQNYLYALPGIILGIVVGFNLDKRIKPQRFRQVILILLLVLGAHLLLN
jgi:uncharacterized membrane protein YfcA